MSEDPAQLRARSSTDGGAVMGGGSIAQRLASSPKITTNPVKPARRIWFFLVVLVLTVGLGAVWTFIAQQQLTSAVIGEAATHLDTARKSFDTLRAQIQSSLQSQCRVLVEDPRLKSTLATEGMDEATVADILKDLGERRRSGFLMVLSPDGRVFAQAGAPELRGLDLSGSSIVNKATTTNDAVVGSWVLAGKVMDLSVMTMRYGDNVIAFLVVGQPVDEAFLRAIADQTGVALASALANNVVLTSSKELSSLLASVANEPTSTQHRTRTANGVTYVTSVADLPETAQSHRLVMAAPVTTSKFDLLRWMIFAPPLLVLLAVLFTMTGIRSTRRN